MVIKAKAFAKVSKAKAFTKVGKAKALTKSKQTKAFMKVHRAVEISCNKTTIYLVWLLIITYKKIKW